MFPDNIKELLLAHRIIDPITNCWLWTARKNNTQYGVISLTRKDGTRKRDFLVHRVSFEIFKQPLINMALHIVECPNKHCFNPEHLYDGMHDENAIDMINAGKGANQAGNFNKTKCSNGHELIKPNLVYWGGRKTCRICAQARTQKYRSKKV